MRGREEERRSGMRPIRIRKSRRIGVAMPYAVLWAALCLLIAGAGEARAAVFVDQVRYWTAPDHTRIVLDLSGPARYEVRRVGDPERIAVNVPGARFRGTAKIPVGDGVIERIRRNALRSRAQVVLDLESAREYRHFVLKAAAGRPDRIVIDVFRGSQRPAGEAATVEAAPAPEPKPQTAPFTVVIDPGHGGMDPGAIRNGVREKDVVLKIARELAAIFDDRPGYRAVLTRKGDYFVSLADRVKFAKREGGDMFLSIHANTNRKRTLKGMEVYFLSLKGATDREARELADKENASDLVGLMPEDHRGDEVLSILMDLRMSRVLDNSSRLAEQILGAARRSDVVGGRKVKQAGFQVLKSLAMPSALVETAYLSNSSDRELLSSASGRRRLAQVIADGVFIHRGDEVIAAGERTWSRVYRVERGDTLWELARDHGTTITEIRERNGLKSSGLLVGQKLKLPQ